MKVLFLDVDGVLNSKEWFAKDRSTESDYLGLRSVNPEAVRRIQRVISATGAVIVLSSIWRLVDDFKATLIGAGLPLFDSTPRIASSNRGVEIMAWIDEHADDIEKFAIIDDDDDAGDCGLRNYFVQTDWQYGMQEEHEKALIALLS